jgi:hypothetical protein
MGQVGSIWTDHTDVRPTILTLTGLADDYKTDGRAVVEPFESGVVPRGISANLATYLRLASAYKQITAPFGGFGMDTLKGSTRGLASNDTDDSTYTSFETRIANLTSRRDALVAQIRTALNSAEFSGQPLNQQQALRWIAEAKTLLTQAHALANS